MWLRASQLVWLGFAGEEVAVCELRGRCPAHRGLLLLPWRAEGGLQVGGDSLLLCAMIYGKEKLILVQVE